MNPTYRGIELEEYEAVGVCAAAQCFVLPPAGERFPKHGDSVSLCPKHTAIADAYQEPVVAGPQQSNPDIERQRRFASHDVNEDQSMRIADLRYSFLVLSERIVRSVRSPREQAVALTKLEESMFFAIAGIAREDK